MSRPENASTRAPDSEDTTRPTTPDPVILEPHTPAWAERFSQEHDTLATIFAGTEHRIEHVGSTAVEGLTAKPIIDILLGVDELPVVESRIARLAASGYDYVARHEAVLPQRRYFRKKRNGRRLAHLHCVRLNSSFFRDHLRFRDTLRSDPKVAREYCELKRRLAGRWRHDRRAYTDGKSEFIRGILAIEPPSPINNDKEPVG